MNETLRDSLIKRKETCVCVCGYSSHQYNPRGCIASRAVLSLLSLSLSTHTAQAESEEEEEEEKLKSTTILGATAWLAVG